MSRYKPFFPLPADLTDMNIVSGTLLLKEKSSCSLPSNISVCMHWCVILSVCLSSFATDHLWSQELSGRPLAAGKMRVTVHYSIFPACISVPWWNLESDNTLLIAPSSEKERKKKKYIERNTHRNKHTHTHTQSLFDFVFEINALGKKIFPENDRDSEFGLKLMSIEEEQVSVPGTFDWNSQKKKQPPSDPTIVKMT